MKITPKLKPKTQANYKCYRCGYIAGKRIKLCPLCAIDGFRIRMIIQMENERIPNIIEERKL